jgi:hypothetical protein
MNLENAEFLYEKFVKPLIERLNITIHSASKPQIARQKSIFPQFFIQQNKKG